MAWKEITFKELELDFDFKKGTALLKKEEHLPPQDRVESAFKLALSTGP